MRNFEIKSSASVGIFGVLDALVFGVVAFVIGFTIRIAFIILLIWLVVMGLQLVGILPDPISTLWN